MYTIPELTTLPALTHGISTVQDGNMSFRWGSQEEVLNDRKRFLSKLKVDIHACVGMSLLHQAAIASVGTREHGIGMMGRGGIEADALATNIPGTFLFLLTGDCFPVLMYDAQQKVIGLAHVSRHNISLHILKHMVDYMKSTYNVIPHNLEVGIGPGIHKESYIKENPEELNMPAWQTFLERKPDGRMALDLLGFIVEQLSNAGVAKQNIRIFPVDTAQSKDFFSHYRSKRTGETEGRFATVVGLKKITTI